MTVVSSALTTAMTTTMAPTSMELGTTLGQYDMVLLPPLIPRDARICVVGLLSVLQQLPQSHMSSEAYINYAFCPQF